MHRTAIRVALGFVLAFAFTGCRSHKAKVADLQKQYDDLEMQFRRDCSAELYKDPPTLSAKCSEENKKAQKAWARLQSERGTK